MHSTLQRSRETFIVPLASSPRDLLFAITGRPEHLIALRRWGAAKEGLAKKRVHVFPDDFSFFGNFEETAEGGLSDQCIAVRQTLRIALGREEIPGRLILVLSMRSRLWLD